MTDQEALLSAIIRNPADALAWLALADWLEESGQGPRAELLRLVRRLRDVDRLDARRPELERRLCALLAGGVRPCVPEVVNSVGMRLALVPAGTFWMGSPAGEKGRDPDETLRDVTIERPFWVGVHLVTQAQYERVMGSNPSGFRLAGGDAEDVQGLDTGDFPVEYVSWDEAAAFLERLNGLPGERDAGRAYRLPTEEEWEYACRGGTTTAFHCGPSLGAAHANFDTSEPYGAAAAKPRLGRTCPVGSYPPNAFGLYDLHGNVWEMCTGGPAEGDAFARVIRGGSWQAYGAGCRSASRISEDDNVDEDNDLGFRVVLEWRPETEREVGRG